MVKKAVVALLLIAVVAAIATLLMTRVDRMIASAIETHGRAATGTDVRLRRVSVSLRERVGTLGGLTVGNPAGFESSYALHLDEIRLDIDLASLGRDVLIVNDVTVAGAHLNAEQRGQSINLLEVQRHMARATPPPPEEEARIIVDRFTLTGASVTLISEALAEQTTLDLRDVSVEGVGRDTNGATYDEATRAMLDPILEAARSAAEQRLRDAARREIEDEARERLRELLERD